MSEIKKQYTLSKIKQLIDINGDSVNFDLNFKVTSTDNETPFQVLVVDQTTLDNTPDLKYKEVKGSISGNILADKNIYQNYFLILKAENQCIVNVEISKKDLPRTPDIAKSPITSTHPTHNQNDMKKHMSKNTINWVKILLTGTVIIIGGGLVYLLFIRKKNDNKKGNDTSSNKFGFVFNSPIKSDKTNSINNNKNTSDSSSYRPSYGYGPSKKLSSNLPSPSPSLSESSSPSDSGSDIKSPVNSLIDRLNKAAS